MYSRFLAATTWQSKRYDPPIRTEIYLTPETPYPLEHPTDSRGDKNPLSRNLALSETTRISGAGSAGGLLPKPVRPTLANISPRPTKSLPQKPLPPNLRP